jgi:hypothetical protein
MLNSRTLVVAAVVVVALLLTVGLLAAGAEHSSKASGNVASVSQTQKSPAPLEYRNGLYRLQYGECYDVSIKDQATCRAESQATVH